RNETLVDALIHRRRQQVRLMLDILDRGDVFVDVRDVAEEGVEEFGRGGEMAGELIEQLEELIVAWEEAAEHGAPESGCVVTAAVTPRRYPSADGRQTPLSRGDPVPLSRDGVPLGDAPR